MSSTIDIKIKPNMTAQQRIEEIQYPLENLEHFLMMLSKMKIDDALDDNDFNAIINILHHQVTQINNVIKS